MLASFKTRQLVQMLWTWRFSRKKVICALATPTREDLEQIKALAEASVLKTVIDRCFPLSQTAAAHRYVASGQKKGSVVIVSEPTS